MLFRSDSLYDHEAVNRIDAQLSAVAPGVNNAVDLALGRTCAVLPERVTVAAGAVVDVLDAEWERLYHGLTLAEDLPSLMRDVSQRKAIKDTGNAFLDAYLKMRNLVRNDFPKGYQVSRLDTPHLDVVLPADGREHPSFAHIQTAELGEAYAGDTGVSTA